MESANLSPAMKFSHCFLKQGLWWIRTFVLFETTMGLIRRNMMENDDYRAEVKKNVNRKQDVKATDRSKVNKHRMSIYFNNCITFMLTII